MRTGLRRPRGTIVQREIQQLTRSFPARFLRIYRETYVYGNKGQKQFGSGPRTVIYEGELLFIPAGGVVQLYGGGQTERTSPTLIVVGNRGVLQGDFVDIDGQTFQVTNVLNHHGYFVELRLDEYRQTAPVVP